MLTEDRAFAFFFRQLNGSHPWEFAIQGKKNANAQGSAQGGGGEGAGRGNWKVARWRGGID